MKKLPSLKEYINKSKVDPELLTLQALDEALLEERFDIADFILCQGLSVNSRGHIDSTILHWQLALPSQRYPNRRNPNVVKWIVNKGADVNAKDDHGLTPLQYGLGKPDVSIECLKILISAGADLTVRFSSGDSLIDYSRTESTSEVVELLKGSGSPDFTTEDLDKEIEIRLKMMNDIDVISKTKG